MFYGQLWNIIFAKDSSAIARFLTFVRLTYVPVRRPYLTIVYVSQVSDGKLLENEVPVFLVQFSTQEVLMFRNAKTREIVVGADDKVEQCVYVAAITRVEEELSNELTGGWKVVEVCSYFSPLVLIFV